MDKYDTVSDHYCYKGTFVLKNKLNIKNMAELERAEREITAFTINNVRYKAPPYNLEYMKMLHRQLFSELYEWAGEFRNVDISKGATRFCNCSRVIAESQKIFSNLLKDKWLSGLLKESFCAKLAEYYCEFNMIHPFREGNGRVQRLLFEHLSLSAGYELDWSGIKRAEWIQANIDGVFVNYEPMEKIFTRIVTAYR
ncbi:putative adenosine monophosphate-protein transferase Fic [Aliikangiella sp. IMCC44359]|uniref:putative adenosine monophosphate-protein transferase Fic n=1 Tax=Aliikangiella sp. IMCC44359 TaxID=3459125 RepID=UPI00403B2D96